MPAENVPTSSQSDGRWRVVNVPSGSNAKSVAILNGGTATAITYGLTSDGYNHTVSQATAEDKRLTLLQDLSRPGKITETLELTAVASSDATSADQVLLALSLSGAETQFTTRRAVANDATFATGQKADVLTGIVGVRRANAPTENGVDTASYTVYLTKPTDRQATLVA
ncbi:hypothetical protein [uncultured Microbacterium sp.]|uniref:phage tail tube protein n=1 Tax=uncultured Microbacterium sp. TaxID=191216 RepID=UPI0025EC3154|nr:hypothetical protein [uncultured Microbacterium sp.]